VNFSQFATKDYEGAGFLFITPDKKILMLQKPNKKWSLVGGHREKKEIPLETAKRETKEEIGFVPNGLIIDFVRYKKKETNTWCYSFIMRVSEKFKPKLSNEHIGYEWISFKKLDKYVISKSVKDLLPHLKYINI
jgi:8-oxo-dGTP pyrophosphatase MutT (NUDIX family)